MALRATFSCAACGGRAATLWLVLPGEPDPPQAAMDTGGPPVREGVVASVFPGACRLIVHGGPVPVVIAPVPRGPVEAALRPASASRLHALDAEYAPFWCPTCRHSYCAAHWTTGQVVDEGFFDGIRGTCPAGHQRLLQD
jgi:hypothetical protein